MNKNYYHKCKELLTKYWPYRALHTDPSGKNKGWYVADDRLDISYTYKSLSATWKQVYIKLVEMLNSAKP